MTQVDRPLIRAVSVKKLFGRFNYSFDVPLVDGVPSRLILLHGDNGSGKTTLLRLIWHTLSSADNRGHRTFIARTAFEEFELSLSDQSSLAVTKVDGLLGSFTVTLSRQGHPDSYVLYRSDEELVVQSPSRQAKNVQTLKRDVQRKLFDDRRLFSLDPHIETAIRSYEDYISAERQYLDFLNESAKSPLYLADDRSLYTDDPEIKRIRDLLSRREDMDIDRRDRLSRLVVLELRVSLRRVNDYLRRLTLGGQTDGSANSNAIYVNVLRRMVQSPVESQTDAPSSPDGVLQTIADIEAISPGYEEYGLVPKFNVEEVRGLILQASPNAELTELIQRVIGPFLSSLRARYDALREAHDLLGALIPGVNAFFAEKEVVFTPQAGLQIQTVDGDLLDVDALSSGERQLMTLLCTTVLARADDARLFIIDEPELSLGVDWQRNILGALTELTDETSVQFVVATHSIEIISSRPDCLVQLHHKI